MSIDFKIDEAENGYVIRTGTFNEAVISTEYIFYIAKTKKEVADIIISVLGDKEK